MDISKFRGLGDFAGKSGTVTRVSGRDRTALSSDEVSKMSETNPTLKALMGGGFSARPMTIGGPSQEDPVARAQRQIAAGGIGSNPFGQTTQQPRSVQTQMFNRPAYQRNRVTTGQMGEMNRANQDRFRADIKPLTTAYDRSLSQANAQQQMADTSVADAASNSFFGLMNGYQQQQNAMTQQGLMPLLSQLFGGF